MLAMTSKYDKVQHSEIILERSQLLLNVFKMCFVQNNLFRLLNILGRGRASGPHGHDATKCSKEIKSRLSKRQYTSAGLKKI